MANPPAEHIRFARPTNLNQTPAAKAVPRHQGVLQDQLLRSQRRPWNPSFSLAVRMLLLVRACAAMYSNIQDCDEVFNFWEPLHYLQYGYGFQTWELSPAYAIRSWPYILVHLVPARMAAFAIGVEKRPAFFAVRLSLALVSTLCEAKLYRAVYDHINEKVGRYLLFMMLFSSGMFNASTALLPSSFALYTSTLAFAYTITPATRKNKARTFLATLYFATGAIVGWPFALALAIPFVFEELFVYGGDRVPAELYDSWIFGRWSRLFQAGATAALLFVPVIAIDTVAYGRLAFVPWNILRYNLFGGAERGPELYGTSHWSFYMLNLFLNFNILAPMALFSVPALCVTYFVDRKRLGVGKIGPDQSSPFTVLSLRLAPLYVWLGALSTQAHKEERFLFPAYTMICFNAAVTLYLVRGWMEAAYVKCTSSPYRASRSSIFRLTTTGVILFSSALSGARIMALWKYYHAPMSAIFALENRELPRVLNVTGLLPVYPADMSEEHKPRMDLSPIKDFNFRLCVAKEWHGFPGHYLVPSGVRVDFVKSEFKGILPGHFLETPMSGGWWLRNGTRHVPEGLNDLNKEEPSHYVPVETCDYLLDLDFPHNPIKSELEPRYAIQADTWERVACLPFLDARYSALLTRTLWFPGEAWQSLNSFGDYCLLKNKASVSAKEKESLARSRAW